MGCFQYVSGINPKWEPGTTAVLSVPVDLPHVQFGHCFPMAGELDTVVVVGVVIAGVGCG